MFPWHVFMTEIKCAATSEKKLVLQFTTKIKLNIMYFSKIMKPSPISIYVKIWGVIG